MLRRKGKRVVGARGAPCGLLGQIWRGGTVHSERPACEAKGGRACPGAAGGLHTWKQDWGIAANSHPRGPGRASLSLFGSPVPGRAGTGSSQ